MATRKNYPISVINDRPNDVEQTASVIPALTVRIYPARNLKNPESKFRGEAAVKIGGCFVVKGFRIFDGVNGLFVKNPQQTYVKNGTEMSRDAFFPITSEARSALHVQILKSYETALNKLSQQNTGDVLDEDDEVPELEDDDLRFEPSEDPVVPMGDKTPVPMSIGM